MKTLLLTLSLLLSTHALSRVELSSPAPDFNLADENGKAVKLSDFKGKTVVLEWLNHGCPFIKKHYNSKNMQETQKLALSQGAIWLSVISSSKGSQGWSTPQVAKDDKKRVGSLAHHILIDESGDVGRLYGAKTTPHMYIVDKDGKLVYQGAIDSIPSADISDIKDAKNYVKMALNDLSTSGKVKVKKSKAYGCSVKY